MLAALEQRGHRPTRLSGSSAGALVAAGFAAGVSTQHFLDEMRALKKEHFWDPGPGLGLLRGRLFRERLRAIFPVDAFASTQLPLAISVFDVFGLKTRVLDSGPLLDAVYASCAVPLMFHPMVLDGRVLLDGGVLDRPGLAGMPPGERVLYHHLRTRNRLRRKHRLPHRDNMVTLIVDGLPAVGPNRLHEGERAYAAAFRETTRALDLPLDEGMRVVLTTSNG